MSASEGHNTRVRITDSTLRDGSHAMAHQFTTEQVRAIVHALDASNVEVIEVTHGDGLGGSSFNYGFSLVDELDLIAAAVQEAQRAAIAVLLLPGLGTIEHLRRARDVGASVARIATHCTEADVSVQHFEAARDLGMETVGFLMLSHRVGPVELARQARIMVDAGAQCVYVVDSAGALVLADAQARVQALITEIGHEAQVGFHGHQNLTLGVANSVLAVQGGARQIDGALCALGAGAGNAPTEVLAATFDRLGIETGLDVPGVLAAAQDVLRPIIPRLPVADRSAIVQGYAGVYSSFLLHAERAAHRYGIPAHVILQRVGEAGYVGGQEDMIIDIAIQLARERDEATAARAPRTQGRVSMTTTSPDTTEVAGPDITDEMREQIVEELGAGFKGAIIRPGHPAYEQARRVWNAMIDRHPGLILRCTCTEDVVAAVGVARAHGLAPAVRGGGHSVSGKAMSEGGLTIDMSGMRKVSVDAEQRLVHVDGGCQLGDVDAATAPHGLVVPAGIMSETGVPGLALGGGIGWFSRMYGLTCDQFESLEVVLASGEVIEVSAQERPELMWALKGGGGNFGVVTRFTFRAQQFGPLMRIGVSLYHPEDAAQALREYAAIVPTLPRTIGWHAALKHDVPALPFVPPELAGQRLLMLISMWLEDADDPAGAELVDRLGAVGSPCVTASTVLPFGGAVQRLLDEEFPDGQRYYTKEAHVSELAGEAIDALVDFWKDMPMHGEIEIIGLGGAIGDIAEDATAFANRQYLLWLNFAMAWQDAGCDADYIARTRKIVHDLEPWTGRGVYVNMLNFDEMDRVVEAFGGPEKYARLGRVKAQYDPDNLFRMNYNITPLAPLTPAG